MEHHSRPSIGLALSGSGNRTSFYIGFLEVFQEKNITIDYITAMSGGSLAAAAFACGTLLEFKEEVLSFNSDSLKQYITKSSSKGGFYSLDALEEGLRNYTHGLTFEEVRPLMSFTTVDIESGEQIDLCMGDIARAARISCTLPGIFEPVKWGNRTLVDGGLLSQIPSAALQKFPVDITIGVNMRGTKHIFTNTHMTLKKMFNIMKKILFVDEIQSVVDYVWKHEGEEDYNQNQRVFSVLGRSLDLAIEASKKNIVEPPCDLLIVPNIPKSKTANFSTDQIKLFYEMGRQSAKEHIPQIEKLVSSKRKVLESL